MINGLRIYALVTLLCVGFVLPASYSRAAGPGSTEEVSTETVLETYGRIPLHFEPNQGQVDSPDIGFISRGSGYTMFGSPDGITLSLSSTDENTIQMLRVLLKGANPQLSISGLEQLLGVNKYLIGSNSAQWQMDIPSFEQVRYDQVWPGVEYESVLID